MRSLPVAESMKRSSDKLGRVEKPKQAQMLATPLGKVARATKAQGKDRRHHPLTRTAATEHRQQMRHFEFRCVSSVVRKVQPLEEEASMSKTKQKDISWLFDVATLW